jgi:membrane-associated phospholipid phosphatase
VWAGVRGIKPNSWWFDVGLLVGFAALTVALAAKVPLLSLDVAIRDFADAHRPTWFYWTLRVLNYLGQGGLVLTPLALLVAAVLAVRRRSVRPFLPVVGAFIATYVTIGPLKLWTDRAAGTSDIEHAEWLFHDPSGLSYPSGHVINAIVWYGVLAMLLRHRVWPVVRVAVPVVVLFTTTYLSFHWLTDGIAAILLGLVLDRTLHRIDWDNLQLPRAMHRRA